MSQDDPAVAATGRLLARAVGHGLRTPLHSLLGFLELLSGTDLDGETRHLVNDARESGDELLAASERLTVLLRLLTGEAPAPPQPFGPHDLLREIALEAGDRTAAVVVDANPYLPSVLHGDVHALRLLLTELVANAVGHGARHAQVYAERLSAFNETPVRVRFTVSDDGPGLNEQALGQYTAAADVLSADPQHVGIFLVRRLARQLGGTLTVSRSDERGTVIALDAAFGTEVLTPDPLPGPEPADRTLHVLLVEDNSVNRILAQRQMARLGHRLDVVTDGESGVDAVLNGAYDVVLMDRHLPDIDGVESARRIRRAEQQLDPPRYTPIIAVTADASPGHRQECHAAGMDGFLTKPLDLEHLRAAIVAATQGHREAAPPAPPTPVVRPAALTRLSRTLDGDHKEVVTVVETYLAELPSWRMRVQAALRRGEARQAASAAETLWTSSETVGAIQLAVLCEQIHHAARTGDLDRGRALLSDLRTACDRTAAELVNALHA
ncbi:response regulator [Dactylosporangium sp. CA-092794]|uniref:response regulator n=1 Tax=Dactylosporangium sp. CA-092794 TaxID=3239929 RepID=UPI003D8C7B17